MEKQTFISVDDTSYLNPGTKLFIAGPIYSCWELLWRWIIRKPIYRGESVLICDIVDSKTLRVKSI
jgi:hypothetical protein